MSSSERPLCQGSPTGQNFALLLKDCALRPLRELVGVVAYPAKCQGEANVATDVCTRGETEQRQNRASVSVNASRV